MDGCLAAWRFDAKAGICPAIKRGATGPGRVCMTTNQHEIAAMTLREMEALNARVARLEAAGSAHAERLEGVLSYVKNMVLGKGNPAKDLFDYVHKNVSDTAQFIDNVTTIKKPNHTITVTVKAANDISVAITGEGNNSTMSFTSMDAVQKYLKSTVPSLSSHAAVDIRPYTSVILRQQARSGYLG